MGIRIPVELHCDFYDHDKEQRCENISKGYIELGSFEQFSDRTLITSTCSMVFQDDNDWEIINKTWSAMPTELLCHCPLHRKYNK